MPREIIDGVRRNTGKRTKTAQVHEFLAYCKQRSIPSEAESLIEWDKKVNGKALLNWDKEHNYWLGLMSQAAVLLQVHMRFRAKVDGRVISVPSVLHTESGYTKVSEMPKRVAEGIYTQFQKEIADRVLRLSILAKTAGLQVDQRRVRQHAIRGVNEGIAAIKRQRRASA